MKSRPIGSLVSAINRWDPRKSNDETFLYVDIAAVDQEKKKITEASVVRSSEAPSRARQLIQSGDILVSTVRPNLNGVARVPSRLAGGTASTGFCVLRPSDGVDGSYLFHWLRSPMFITDMVKKSTGQSYPAVSDRIIKDSTMPIPSLVIQQRIAESLDHLDALRTKRREAIALLDELTQSIFLDMFGDPVTNPKSWKTVPLATLGMLDRGVSKHRPRNAPELLGGAHPLIQTGDVAASKGYIERYEHSYSDLGLAQSKLWPAGTLCITIAANIAKTGILTFDACFPDSVVGFTAEPETVEYVRVWLSFLQETLERNAPESAQKNINLGILRGLQVPKPPSEMMASFATRIKAANDLRSSHLAHLAHLDELFASVQDRAFKGELWNDGVT